MERACCNTSQFLKSANQQTQKEPLSTKEKRLFSGSSRNLGGRAAWGRVCGRAKLGAGTLCCLHLCWRLPWDWSDAELLGRCPKPHKGRCPLTLQGADEKGRSPPLDPSARLSWSRFHAPSACSFLVLCLSSCLLPQTFREEPFFISPSRNARTAAQPLPPHSCASRSADTQ